MNGLEMLRRVRREYPQLRVVMFSTLNERGAAITLEALILGANDYVAKASHEGSLDRSLSHLREEISRRSSSSAVCPGTAWRQPSSHIHPRRRQRWLADSVLPLGEIVPEILRITG
jgi:chemotaxis response regulator CheB